MSNINLLPEEMRARERKEMMKAAKQPKVFTVDLSAAQKDLPISPIRPSKPPRSLWSEIFGRKIKPAPMPKVATFGGRSNMVEATRNQNYRNQEVPGKTVFKTQNNFLNSIGPAQSPVRPIPSEKITPAKPSFEPSPKSSKTEINYKYANSFRPKRRGFWSSFMSLFSSKSKPQRLPQMNRPEMERKIAAPPKPKVIEPPKPMKKTEEKYHTAPKAEKSKFDINLIPQELLFKKYPKSRQQVIGIMLAIFIPALIITAIYVTIDQQQQSIEAKITQLNNDKNELITYINSFKDIQQKNIRLQDKILAINKLLQKHVYWTKFFSLLERYTLDDVYYTEFTADTSGEFMLPAVAALGSGSTIESQIADSYRKVAEQISAFKKAADFVSRVDANNLEIASNDNAGIKGVKFEINLSLKDGVFIK